MALSLPLSLSAYAYRDLPALGEHKTWAEIDLMALQENYRLLHRTACTAGERAIAVVKADAYGHGAAACVRALLAEGCDFFAVSCIEEAIAVREACCGVPADILILGYTLPGEAGLLAQYSIIQTVFSAQYAASLAAAAEMQGCVVRVHIKLDTGMNRLGFPTLCEHDITETADAIAAIAAEPKLSVCGIFTHFARADETDASPVDAQFARFHAVCDALIVRGVNPGLRHACNSAAAVRFPAGRLDAVRFGIMLYGVAPSPEFAARFPLPLKPVMRFCTRVAQLHTLSPGEAVSYGGHYAAHDPRVIATLPVGYADGWIRAFSGASVLIETAGGCREAPVVGNICMDQCMLDVTGLDVNVGDTVILFGDAPSRLRALAERAHTIEYEPLCLVSGRVPRLYRGRTEH